MTPELLQRLRAYLTADTMPGFHSSGELCRWVQNHTEERDTLVGVLDALLAGQSGEAVETKLLRLDDARRRRRVRLVGSQTGGAA